MNQVKILHCADLHLGSELTTLGRKAAARKAELKNTFMDIVKLCKNEQIQLFLIAGDLFDSVRIAVQDMEEIRDAFAGIAETIVAISPGNHDPLTIDSPYLKSNFWPSNVIIFDNDTKNVELESLGVRLWGSAFSSAYAPESSLAGITAPDDTLINICLVHGDLISPGQISNYNPITEALIAGSNMDYIALGHIHQRSEIMKAGDTHYAYSGCPEGRGFDESGDKGVYIGFVAKNACRLKYRKLSRRMNLELAADISGAINSAAAAETVLAKIRDRFGTGYGENLYKIVLEGTVPDYVNISLEEIKTTLSEELFFVKVNDRTEIDTDSGALESSFTLKGIFIRKMLEQIDAANKYANNDAQNTGNDKEMLQRALKLGLKAFSGEVKYIEDK